MSREDLRKRLESLNGGPLAETLAEEETSVPDSTRKRPKSGSGPSRAGSDATAGELSGAMPRTGSADPTPDPKGEHRRPAWSEAAAWRSQRKRSSFLPLHHAVPGQVFVHSGRGECWLVERSGAALPEWAEGAARHAEQKMRGELAPRLSLAARRPIQGLADLVFMDLETTGLSDCPLFLIGAMQVVDGTPVLRQYLARTLQEEAAVLSAYLETAGRKPVLVTYNGKSFDLPFVQSRALLHGIPCSAPAWHLDLIFPARQHYRRSLPNCKLQTLEKTLCKRTRTGDIPGAEIPVAYQAFLRTGNASEMSAILEHNVLDILTMLELLCILPIFPRRALGN